MINKIDKFLNPFSAYLYPFKGFIEVAVSRPSPLSSSITYMLLLLFHGDQPKNQIRQAQQDQYLGPSIARFLLRPPTNQTPPFT